MTTSPAYYNLLDALPQQGCAICRLLAADAESFIDSLLYDFTGDVEIHMQFRAMRGLCNEHSWQMMNYPGRSGNITHLQRSALDEMLTILGRSMSPVNVNGGRLMKLLGQGENKRGRQLAQNLQPTEPCACCVTVNGHEQVYTGIVAEYINQDKFLAALRESNAFCLNHFCQIAPKTRTNADLNLLIEIQREQWASLKVELDTFIANYIADGAAPMGDERDSYRRSVGVTAGGKGVFGSER